MFSIVLHLNKYRIFSEIGLKAYEKFFDKDEIKDFFIIYPKEDLDEINKIIENSSLPFKLIVEENFDEIKKVNDSLLRQQLINLLIYRFVRTQYYLVINSDIFPTKEIKYSDLFFDNKILYHSEAYQEVNGKYYSQNSIWWKNSCNLLNLDVSILYEKMDLMGNSPQIFISDIVMDLLLYVKNKWDITKIEFTEFTLYWLYLIKIKKTNLYSKQKNGLIQIWRHDHKTNLIDPQDYDLNYLSKTFSKPTFMFCVIHNWLLPYIDIEKILSVLKCDLEKVTIDKNKIDKNEIDKNEIDKNEIDKNEIDKNEIELNTIILGDYQIIDCDNYNYDCYISSTMDFFTKNFIEKYNIDIFDSYIFNSEYPKVIDYDYNVCFIKKSINNIDIRRLMSKYNSIFLRIKNYDWLLSISYEELIKFKQILIEDSNNSIANRLSKSHNIIKMDTYTILFRK
jgi:hypothetical protein